MMGMPFLVLMFGYIVIASTENSFFPGGEGIFLAVGIVFCGCLELVSGGGV